MFFSTLALDYDGTLATDGRVDDATIASLTKLLESGRRLILVTGRVLPELQAVFPRLDLFERVVAENGALIYRPQTREEVPLIPPPPPEFVARLQALHVNPLSVGQGIVATWVPNDHHVLAAIRELGLNLQITYNKGAVMVLPAGVNKASGLTAALAELHLSPHNVVGVGDAENDEAFLNICGCSIAVANALEAVKAKVDWVTESSRGAGVQEVVASLIDTDLHDVPLRRSANILLGTSHDGAEIRAEWRGEVVLLAGSSGSGKTTFICSLLEQIAASGLQVVIVDPEGEYEGIADAISLGDTKSPPALSSMIQILSEPNRNVSLNLLAIPLAERPAFAAEAMARVDDLRLRLGRPHWVVLDEAHHLFPAALNHLPPAMPRVGTGFIMVTTQPRQLLPAAVEAVDIAVGVGESPAEIIAQVAKAHSHALPGVQEHKLEVGEGLLWRVGGKDGPQYVRLSSPQQLHQRHKRKYVEGHLGEDTSFYFRGPDSKLNLRADNLQTFLQMAEGVDDDTWRYHLHQGDITTWFKDVIKDDDLAAEVLPLEKEADLPPKESRARIREIIERRYIAA